jgi:pyridoxamine 5'-phosphate oxidase
MSSIDDLRAHLSGLRTLVRGVAGGLSELSAREDPLDQFRDWFEDAEASGLLLPESTALATASPDGVPSVRMVLLKGVDERGFRFFTNYGSRKAEELEANPRAALCFHWSVLERQIRVEGAVERLSVDESEEYFRSRDRGSQIGAWASEQSHPLERRADLEARVREMEVRFLGQPVPLPEHWGGFVLRPARIEFWQGRANRLHDRLVYTPSSEGGWHVTRLQP